MTRRPAPTLLAGLILFGGLALTLTTTGVAGFFGASSAERLPTERAIKAQIEQFKAIPLD